MELTESATSLCELKHTLEGHVGAALSVKFTKNGRYILSAGQDKSVRLWNPHTGQHIKTYTGPHNQEVNDVIVHDDNTKFLSCGGDKQFYQWDVAQGKVIRKFVGHDRKVNALAFGPGEEVVLSASHDKSVRLWDLRARSGSPIQVLTEATDSVLCLTVSGDEIASGSTDGCVRRYDVRRGQLVVDRLLQPVGSLMYTRDRAGVLVSTLDSKIRLLDRESGYVLALYEGHTNTRFKVQSSLDPLGAYVVSGSEDNTVCFWELVEAKMTSSFKAHTGPVFCVQFYEDVLVTAAADGVVMVWAVAMGPSKQPGAPSPRATPAPPAAAAAAAAAPPSGAEASAAPPAAKRARGDKGRKGRKRAGPAA